MCYCFYKGLISFDQLESAIQANGLSRDAIDYAIGNWHFCNGDHPQARVRLERLSQEGAWNSFGFIAAESDLSEKSIFD